MKTDKFIFILFILIFALSGISLGKYSGGTGEPNDPYRIATPNDLNSIGLDPNDWDKRFLMTADINMAGITGTQFNIIGVFSKRFTGVFDGNGHTISNFNYSTTGTDNIGIFAYVDGPSAVIKNVGLINPDVDAGMGLRVGSLFARIDDATVSNCWVERGVVSGRWSIGGLGGDSRGGMVLDSYSTALVIAEDHGGGLIGSNILEGTVSHCYASGNVSADGVADEVSAVGGLVAYNYGTISNCYATGNVSGVDRCSGGLVGNHSGGTITNCFATGDVSDDGPSGGLVGSNYWSTIINCFAAGEVSGPYAGGLVGEDYYLGGSYVKCFWDRDINPDANGIGNDIDPNVVGLPTAEMQQRSTFADAGWDMVEVWDIGENQTYPFLRTHLPSDINKDGETDFYDLAILAEHWLGE